MKKRNLFIPVIENNRTYLFIVILSVLFLNFSSGEQNDEPSWIDEIVQTYKCTQSEQERLFVFLNSGFYYPGERVNFKAVLFNTDLKVEQDGSRYFYLQIENAKGESIGEYVYTLNKGECSGEIILPDTLHTGIYKLKAFTNWMRNIGEESFYERPFLVISPLNGLNKIDYDKWSNFQVRFFPEGGNLIATIENNILVELNKHRYNFFSKLNIKDKNGNILQTCNTDSNGIGTFTFTPVADAAYYAVPADSMYSNLKIRLPEIKKYGACMNLKYEGNTIKVKINVTDEPVSSEKLFFIILSGDAENLIKQEVQLINGEAILSYPKNMISAGMNQLLLCSENNILAKRLFYRKETDKIIDEEVVTEIINTRQNIDLTADFTAETEKTNTLSFTVNEYDPVTDYKLYNELAHYSFFDIYSSLSGQMLSTFLNINASEENINDYLIAYPETNILNFMFSKEKAKKYIKETSGLVLSGWVISNETGLPVKGATVLMSCPDSVAYLNYCITNDNGDFHFVINERLSDNKVYLVVLDYPEKENKVRIVLDDKFETGDIDRNTNGKNLTHFDQLINDHRNIAMAFRVFNKEGIKGNDCLKVNKFSSHYNFYGEPDFSVVPSEYESLPDIYEIKKNLITGLKLDKADNFYDARIFDNARQKYYSEQALVLYDNIPFPKLNFIQELNTEMIKRIDLKKNLLFYDEFVIHGIFAIYTHNPKLVESHYCNKITAVPLIHGPKTFITVPDAGNYLPDLRHSLYWNPDQAIESGKAEIQFISSDIKGKYMLKAYYMDENSRLRFKTGFFVVNE